MDIILYLQENLEEILKEIMHMNLRQVYNL